MGSFEIEGSFEMEGVNDGRSLVDGWADTLGAEVGARVAFSRAEEGARTDGGGDEPGFGTTTAELGLTGRKGLQRRKE